MPKKNRKHMKTPQKSRKELRASVKKQHLSRALYELPLELKILIFQFAVLANMTEWSKKHAEKFQGILFAVNPKFMVHQEHRLFGHYSNYMEFYEYMREFNPDQFLGWVKPPEPVPICEKCPEVRHKVNIPWDWVRQRVTEERYDQLECRDWGPENMCEYWHNPKCWCKDCYDIRDLTRVYQETMRHWFLKYQGLKTEWLAQLRDRSISEEKRDLKLGFISLRENECLHESPHGFFGYLERNYTWSNNLWAYVPK